MRLFDVILLVTGMLTGGMIVYMFLGESYRFRRLRKIEKRLANAEHRAQALIERRAALDDKNPRSNR